MFKIRILNRALLGATAAIALCAQQAFAFGMMGGGAVGAHIGGMGSGRPAFTGGGAGARSMAGAVTMNGITVLQNGTIIVPAVTPRVRGVGPADPQLNQLNAPPSEVSCAAPYCAP